MTDLVMVNKCDGDLMPSARRTASDYTSALKLMRPKLKGWKPKVCLISSKTGTGLDEAWEKMNDFKNILLESDEFHKRRSMQRKKWMWNYIQNRLLDMFNEHPDIQAKRKKIETLVLNQNLSPADASDILISEFLKVYDIKGRDVKR